MVGMKARIARWRYVYGWRLRHWWFDTREGAVARWCALFTGLLACAIEGVRLFTAPAPAPGQPHESIIWFIVWAIVAVIAALAVVLATSSKPPAPADQKVNAPVTQDGQSLKRIYGTYWVDDSAMAAWKVTGKDAIKSDGGGKK